MFNRWLLLLRIVLRKWLPLLFSSPPAGDGDGDHLLDEQRSALSTAIARAITPHCMSPNHTQSNL
jgi:hypothetical protein